MLTARRFALVASLLVALASLTAHTTAHAASPSLPSVTAAQAAEYGGMRVWRVSFSNGATCDVPAPLVDTLGGASQPRVGAVLAYDDTRITVAGVRLWGALSFTDGAGQRHTGY